VHGGMSEVKNNMGGFDPTLTNPRYKYPRLDLVCWLERGSPIANAVMNRLYHRPVIPKPGGNRQQLQLSGNEDNLRRGGGGVKRCGLIVLHNG